MWSHENSFKPVILTFVIVGAMSFEKGSVYFEIKTMIEAATIKSAERPKKNSVKLWWHQKRPKGQKDAKRAKTSNKSLSASFRPFGVFWLEGSLTKFFLALQLLTAAVAKFLLWNSHFLWKGCFLFYIFFFSFFLL